MLNWRSLEKEVAEYNTQEELIQQVQTQIKTYEIDDRSCQAANATLVTPEMFYNIAQQKHDSVLKEKKSASNSAAPEKIEKIEEIEEIEEIEQDE